MKVVKNKHAPPFRTAQFELEFGRGICRDSEIIDLGCRHKLISKSGGGFYAVNGRSFRGKDALKRYFNEDGGSVREDLLAKLRHMLVAPPRGGGEDGDYRSEDQDESEQDAQANGTDEEDIIAAMEA